MLAQDSHPWTGIQWLGDHVIPKVKMLLRTWTLTGRTHKIQAWIPPPQQALQEGRISQSRHTLTLLLLFFMPCKLLFLLPVDMLLFSVTFAIADILGVSGINLSESLLLWGGRIKIHPTRNRSLCAAQKMLTASAVRTEEKREPEKQGTPRDKEIPSTSVGR